ncbi:MAG: glycosyltransferase family A protein [bacterium]
MPKISVIIPAYKNTDLVYRSVGSLETQTIKDFEVVLINNGSLEDVEKIFTYFKDRKILNIKYLHIEKNEGIMHAYNFALKNINTEFVAFLDSDDEYFDSKLEEQYNVFLKNNTVDIVACLCEVDKFGVRYVSMRNKDFNRTLNSKQAIDAFLENNWSLIPNTLMIKKSLFDKIDFVFDERFKVAGDIDLAISVLKAGNFYGISKPLFRYYIHNDNTSGLTSKIKCLDSAKDQELLLKKHLDIYSFSKKIYAQQIKWIGVLYFLGGELNKGRKLMYKALSIHINKKNIMTFVLSLCGYEIFLKVFMYRTKNAR